MCKWQGTTRAWVRTWLNPPTDQNVNDALENSRTGRVEGTAEWIFSDPQFLSWKHQSAVADGDGFENVLWVRG